MAQFQTQEKDGLHVITCPSIIEAKDSAELDAAVKSWLISSAQTHVLDMGDVMQLKQSAYRAFVLFNQALKANGKSLFCVNVPAKLMPQIKQDGLTSVFVAVATLDEAKRRGQPNRNAVRLRRAFFESGFPEFSELLCFA